MPVIERLTVNPAEAAALARIAGAARPTDRLFGIELRTSAAIPPGLGLVASGGQFYLMRLHGDPPTVTAPATVCPGCGHARHSGAGCGAPLPWLRRLVRRWLGFARPGVCDCEYADARFA